MSLFLATLLPGLVLAVLGVVLLANRPAIVAALKAFPRSKTSAVFLFGGAAAWFLWLVWTSSSADNFDHPGLITLGFGIVAVSAFKCVPDFLAVRGLCILVLLTASPVLTAAYMQYSHPQRLFMVTLVYLLIALAIWVGVQPYRLRDFFNWLFLRPGRTRGVGGVLLAYGLMLAVVAFTY